MTAGNWLRVSPEHPCLTCGKSDWCLNAKDGTASLCQRLSEGAVRRCGDAGWLHRHRNGLEHQLWATKRFTVPVERPALREDLANLNAEFRAAVDPRRLDRLAADLGLSVPCLQRLGIGWCARSSAWSFPMTNCTGDVLGIRLRTGAGRKFAIKGSHDGLFVSVGLDKPILLLIAEGPTDTAALLDLGFDAIGRPSCRGGSVLAAELVRKHRPDETVIVADRDEPGQEGARALVPRLLPCCRRLRIVTPPSGVKDARAWMRTAPPARQSWKRSEPPNPIRSRSAPMCPSHQPGPEGGDVSAETPLLITSSRPLGCRGKAIVTATIGDQCLHRDTIDLNKAADREQFTAALVRDREWIDRQEAETKLLNPQVDDLQAAADGGNAGDSRPEPESHAQALLRLAGEAHLFHTEDGRTSATVAVVGHIENHPIRSTSFRRWLIRAFYAERGGPPSSEALQAALGVLESKAEFDGPLERVWTRVAKDAGSADPDDPTYYVDLCNPRWQAVEITRRGWRVIDNPPGKFRRTKGMMALPIPESGGAIEDLRRFVNLGTDQDWRLFVAFLTAALRPQGPYPILAINGEQGSAKSTTTRVARKTVDPNATLLRCEPKEVRDLMIAATNAWAVTLDNLSSLPTWLSDALCRLATGGGFSTRTLYENDEETHFDAMRPVLLNGIEDVATRCDLLDRCIALTLPTIPEDKRREEGPFWLEFEAALPKILGALFDAMVGGLRELPSVKLDRLPRMADFAPGARRSVAPSAGRKGRS